MVNERNSSRRLLNWFMGIATALLIAAVSGIWNMGQEISSMSSTIESWSRTFADVQARVYELEKLHRTGQHEGADRRLRDLESIHNPASPHFYREEGGR